MLAPTGHDGQMEIEIRQEEEGDAGRYRVLVDGQDAGEQVYRMVDGRRVFIHTEIDEQYEGHGLAGKVTEHALAQARAEGTKIVPLCPYVRGYLERHPEDADLVDNDLWKQLRRA